MKLRSKTCIAALIISSSLVFTACSGNTSNKHSMSDSTHTEAGHHHTYACPMHPDVTGKEGDTCPKCGMKLEPTDSKNASNANGHFMDLSVTPSVVNPGQEVMLSLTPKIIGNEKEKVALDVEHEKKIHLILVNEDLSWFEHIHPEYNNDGSYKVPAKFPAGGKYMLFADYKPTGGKHTLDKLTLNVTGNTPAPATYKADKLTGDAGDGFTVTLAPTRGKFITGVPMQMTGVVKLNGRGIDVNTLENYLGAKAHMVVVSLEDKEYLHVHPSVKDGKFDLHTTFQNPGLYRGWIQFQSKGKVYTADFVITINSHHPSS